MKIKYLKSLFTDSIVKMDLQFINITALHDRTHIENYQFLGILLFITIAVSSPFREMFSFSTKHDMLLSYRRLSLIEIPD